MLNILAIKKRTGNRVLQKFTLKVHTTPVASLVRRAVGPAQLEMRNTQKPLRQTFEVPCR